MEDLFISVLNMSLTASYVIAAIILARLFLKKAPKFISCILWAVAGFRLVFPFSFESVFSLIPFKTQPIPADIAMQPIPRVDSGIIVVDNAVSSVLPAAAPVASVNPLQIWQAIVAYLWLAGIAVMLIYSVVSIILLKRQLRDAVLTEGNIYEANNLKTPFVLGFIHPKIYIPSGLSAEEKSYIILHEQTHIKRIDHLVKLASFLILCVHWFNPLVWMAFLLMSADMEMSCDERVLREMGGDIKKSYSTSLLSMATGRRLINGSPLAFGEGNIKGRIKNVLNFRKPTVWVIVVSVVLVAILSLGFAANKAAPDNSSAGVPLSEATRLQPTAPKLLPGQSIGVDMVNLDYASDDIVIFHDYFGLFVYDLNSKKIIRSLDLNPIGCTATQGDNYCDVTVSADGNTIQLHPMSSKNMYVYIVSDNTLQETVYERMENRFTDFVDIVDVIDYQNAGNYSHTAVKFDTGEYGYLHASDLMLGTLTYVRGGDMLYRLFDFGESSSLSAPPSPAAELKTGKTDSVNFFVTTSPSKYSLAMSFTPGLRLDITYDGPTAQILYEAETGGFITWQNPVIKDLGNSVTRPADAPALYWRPNSDTPLDDVITLTVLNEAGDKIAGSAFSITKGDDGFFTAFSKPPENIDLKSSSTVELWELISRAFAEAFFEKNTEVIKSYLLVPDKGFHEYNLGNGLSNVESMKLKFDPNEIKSDSVSAQYEFKFDGDDSYTYLQLSMKKVNDVWKIESYGLEK